MEAWELAVEVGVAVVSGTGAAGGVLWSMARKLQRLEDAVGRLDRLEHEVDEDRKAQVDQWQELNRTLGRIEGSVVGGLTPRTCPLSRTR